MADGSLEIAGSIDVESMRARHGDFLQCSRRIHACRTAMRFCQADRLSVALRVVRHGVCVPRRRRHDYRRGHGARERV